MKPEIKQESVDKVNGVLEPLVDQFIEVVNKYGTVEEINRKAKEARKNLPQRVSPDKLEVIDWIKEQDLPVVEEGENPVTIEVSALQYFDWIKPMVETAVEEQSLIPKRLISVRNMQEQEKDGDLPAILLAADTLGVEVVETLDSKGTNGSNVHLGGAETITGYFGGVGEPNEQALKWLDEALHYYTEYGVDEVLNINQGTMLLGNWLHQIGVNLGYKASVFTGHDNQFMAFQTLASSKMWSREDGSTGMRGLNPSNSANVETVRGIARIRDSLDLPHIRIEHHVTETNKGIVVQPYNRRNDILELAGEVSNLGAKHEGGEPGIDTTTNILDYFTPRDKADHPRMLSEFLNKIRSANITARELQNRGLSVSVASRHYRTVLE